MCSKCIKLDNLVVQMKTYRPDCYRKKPKVPRRRAKEREMAEVDKTRSEFKWLTHDI